jgi:hypothetical protein
MRISSALRSTSNHPFRASVTRLACTFTPPLLSSTEPSMRLTSLISDPLIARRKRTLTWGSAAKNVCSQAAVDFSIGKSESPGHGSLH